jgi:hypothetical protein
LVLLGVSIWARARFGSTLTVGIIIPPPDNVKSRPNGVRKSGAALTPPVKLILEHTVLFYKIVDDCLLVAVKPAGQIQLSATRT